MMTPYSDTTVVRSVKDIEKELKVAERVMGNASSEGIRRDAEAIVSKLKKEMTMALLCNA